MCILSLPLDYKFFKNWVWFIFHILNLSAKADLKHNNLQAEIVYRIAVEQKDKDNIITEMAFKKVLYKQKNLNLKSYLSLYLYLQKYLFSERLITTLKR